MDRDLRYCSSSHSASLRACPELVERGRLGGEQTSALISVNPCLIQLVIDRFSALISEIRGFDLVLLRGEYRSASISVNLRFIFLFTFSFLLSWIWDA